MFKIKIENNKKLKLNGAFEFIDWDKNCDKLKKKKKKSLKQKKDNMHVFFLIFFLWGTIIYVSVNGWGFVINV